MAGNFSINAWMLAANFFHNLAHIFNRSSAGGLDNILKEASELAIQANYSKAVQQLTEKDVE